jgi:hypothetical protein
MAPYLEPNAAEELTDVKPWLLVLLLGLSSGAPPTDVCAPPEFVPPLDANARRAYLLVCSRPQVCVDQRRFIRLAGGLAEARLFYTLTRRDHAAARAALPFALAQVDDLPPGWASYLRAWAEKRGLGGQAPPAPAEKEPSAPRSDGVAAEDPGRHRSVAQRGRPTGGHLAR